MLLQLKNIRKYFSISDGFLTRTTAFVKAVNNISLDIQKGENVSLVGESGCGKTTLARLIVRLMPLDAGSIVFEGQDVTNLTQMQLRSYRKCVQIVFQDPFSSLDPRFTVRSIMKEAMILDAHAYKSEQDKEDRSVELLKAVGLNPQMLNRYPHEFSGGERQRIAIARALVLNPKLLILDEAVSSLDVIIQEQILELLKNLQQKFELTYLFISHNLKVVQKISQKTAVMYKGKIVELAQTQAIFNCPLHPYTQELLMAALNYQAILREKEIEIQEQTPLIDKGNGHFVLMNP